MTELSGDTLWWQTMEWINTFHFCGYSWQKDKWSLYIYQIGVQWVDNNNLLDKSITWVMEVYLRISHFHIQNAKLCTEQHRLTCQYIPNIQKWELGSQKFAKKELALDFDSQHHHKNQGWWQTSVILILGYTGCKILKFMFNERSASKSKVEHDWGRCLKSVLTSDSPNGG